MASLIFLCSLLLSLPVNASEMVGALSSSLGGTGRAAVQTNESLYLNPASIALMDKFYAGASYQTGFLRKDIRRSTYNITFSDGTAGLIMPGSFGFRQHQVSDKGFNFEENEFKVGFGYRIAPRLSFGFGVSHLRAEDQMGDRTKQTNADLGLLIGLQPNWGLSVNGENLLAPKDDVPEALRRDSRVAVGTQYIHERYLTLRYEALMPLHLENTQYLGHRFGMGVGLQSHFAANFGFSVDDSLQENWASGGLAWTGPRLKLAYSYQREQRQSLGDRHLIDLWMDL